jgi:hypothetical protein
MVTIVLMRLMSFENIYFFVATSPPLSPRLNADIVRATHIYRATTDKQISFGKLIVVWLIFF